MARLVFCLTNAIFWSY